VNKRKHSHRFRIWIEFKNNNSRQEELETVRNSLSNIFDNPKIIKWSVQNKPRFASHPSKEGGINIEWNI